MAASALRYAVVTGGNQGLGLLAAQLLCAEGFHVTITVRSAEKGESAISSIKSVNAGAAVDYSLMNLSELASVREFGAKYAAKGNPLHVLVNNAGIMATPFEKTVDGIESQFQVNHLAHFLLTSLLLPQLIAASAPGRTARVVNLASRAHLRWNEPLNIADVRSVTPDTYDRWQAYGRSKTANILFARGFAARFPPSGGVTMNAMHPGLVDTGLLAAASLDGKAMGAIPVEEGVRTVLHLATSPDLEGVSGKYFYMNREETRDVSSWASSTEQADVLWNGSLELVGLTADSFGKPSAAAASTDL